MGCKATTTAREERKGRGGEAAKDAKEGEKERFSSCKLEEGAEKVCGTRKGRPQRLKPYCKDSAYGTAEAVPLSKADFFSILLKPYCKCGTWGILRLRSGQALKLCPSDLRSIASLFQLAPGRLLSGTSAA